MKKIVFILTNIFISIGMVLVGRASPEGVEKIYSRKIYPVITDVLLMISRPISLSLTEVYFVLTAIIIIMCIVLWIYFSVRRKAKKGGQYLLGVFMILSINITLFLTIWGMNNYRQDVETLFEFEDTQLSQEDLEQVYQWLVAQVNLTKEDMTKEDVLSANTIMIQTDVGFKNLSVEYPFIVKRSARVKPLSISELFSQSGYSGIYLYVFSEPTINTMPHITSLPFVASHEMAHQQGFASEDDANFVGFLSAVHHDQVFFRYSAYLAGMTYFGNSLYQTDTEAYYRLNSQLSEEVRMDLKERSEFWQKNIRPKTEKLHNEVNDLFLKANNQPDGILNYSNVTKLVVLAYKNGLLNE